MRMLVVLLVLCGPAIAAAQIISSGNLGCTVVAPSGMACNGIVAPTFFGIVGPETKTKEEGQKLPRLFITHFKLEPGAVLDEPSSSSDCLLVGINGGDLLNESAPFHHVSLGKDSVTLMPREQPFRLRNKGSETVEFQMIEIRR
jgi:hypothetical protein